MKQIRQGDVLLEEVDAVPAGAARIPAVNGRLVLAEGEATGHAHTVAEQYGELYEKDGTLYLSLTEAVPLEHQEHGAVVLVPRVYRKVQQREWTDAMEPRPVLD